MHQAIEELKQLKVTIEKETWVDEKGKKSVLTGIKMCIARLERRL